jgi:hypothetical protein
VYRRAELAAAAIIASLRSKADKVDPAAAVIVQDFCLLYDVVYKHRALRDMSGCRDDETTWSATDIFYPIINNKDWSLEGVKARLWALLEYRAAWEKFFATFDVSLCAFGVEDRNTAIHAILRLASYCVDIFHASCPLQNGPRLVWEAMLQVKKPAATVVPGSTKAPSRKRKAADE